MQLKSSPLHLAVIPKFGMPLLLIAPFFLWGTAMVAMKGVMPNTTPLFMAGVRLLPAGLLVLLVAQMLGKPQPRGWLAWGWIMLFALVDGTLFQGFLAEGLMRTGAGLGSVMIDSQPIAVALMALWFFGERVGVWGWLGLAIGIVGISVLGLPDAWIVSAATWLQSSLITGHWAIDATWLVTDEHPVQHILTALFHNGQWLMLLASLSMAVGTIISRAVSKYADPVVATGWHMVLGGMPLWLGSGLWESEQWIHLSANHWAAMAYSTVFGSALAYGLFFYFASSGSLTSLSSLTFLTPVFALLFGNVLLGETLSPIQWVGVSFTLVSIYLINQRDRISERFRQWFLWVTGQEEPMQSDASDLSPSVLNLGKDLHS